MEANPSRAKRRISSIPSHGFLERLRRSTLWALVSVAAFDIFVYLRRIACLSSLVFFFARFSRENKKPTARLIWRWVISAGIKKNPLGRQPPRASAHECTTTSAHAHRGKVLSHHTLHPESNAFGGTLPAPNKPRYSAWINILALKIQLFLSDYWPSSILANTVPRNPPQGLAGMRQRTAVSGFTGLRGWPGDCRNRIRRGEDFLRSRPLVKTPTIYT